MPISIPRSLVEFLLLGPEDDRRQLQDSPILGDVWVEFAKQPAGRLELLITPYKDHAAGLVASKLSQFKEIRDADIAYLQGIVAARLSFEEVLRFVVPLTQWWNDTRIAGAMAKYTKAQDVLRRDVGQLLEAARKWQTGEPQIAMSDIDGHKRYVALAGLILWAQEQPTSNRTANLPPREQIQRILHRNLERPIAARVKRLFETLAEPDRGFVWTVSLNRKASPALSKSVPAVKADAARTLFTVNCAELVWAVVDSGIYAPHPAFRDGRGGSRVRKAFDFTRIREIVSLDNARDPAKLRRRVAELRKSGLKQPPSPKKAEENLRRLADEAKDGRSINWELVEPLVEIDPGTVPPATYHGTHVAGILGASRAPNASEEPAPAGADNLDWVDGMCPEISLYDFRVLAPTLRETEFAIIAALQYIRYINERNSYITIHGANLSLSIPHDVRNYACGRTPVCNECERLVNSGVVVVAAAGNRGYQNFETKDGLYEGYAAFSVTDPGNAEGVITVGATHRYWPHTYGVSFFSSRGPTGDGRLKPDLVAPGERIRAPLPNDAWGDLDGTSMAAPHVSGAAAMLMARYSELVGQPRRIKQILCDSATDLGRERSFQGHGMLDVLRAFQSI
jgi:hypothetical protein